MQNKQAFAGGRLAAAGRDFMASLFGPVIKAGNPATIIDRRADFLAAYQNANYAQRYTALVESVRGIEDERLPGSTTLTTAVAKSLFKLMAYKDEYEVARLHMETGFQERLRQEFEGDFAVKYHLAPPLAFVRQGRPRPAAEAAVRTMDPAGVSHPGATEVLEGHRLRSIRLHRGSPD